MKSSFFMSVRSSNARSLSAGPCFSPSVVVVALAAATRYSSSDVSTTTAVFPARLRRFACWRFNSAKYAAVILRC